MGKMKPAKRSSVNRPTSKTPLADEIESLKLAKAPKMGSVHPYSAQSRAANASEEDDAERIVDSRITAKILNQARLQQTELQDEFDENNNDEQDERASTGQFKKFQSNFIEQQKIRHNDESSDSDTDNDETSFARQPRAGNESYSDEEVLNISIKIRRAL